MNVHTSDGSGFWSLLIYLTQEHANPRGGLKKKQCSQPVRQKGPYTHTKESFHVKRSSGRAGTVSDLLHSLIIYLFQQEQQVPSILRPNIERFFIFSNLHLIENYHFKLQKDNLESCQRQGSHLRIVILKRNISPSNQMYDFKNRPQRCFLQLAEKMQV